MENYQRESVGYSRYWFVHWLRAMYFIMSSASAPSHRLVADSTIKPSTRFRWDVKDTHWSMPASVGMRVCVLCVNRKVEMSKWWYRNQKPTKERMKKRKRKQLKQQKRSEEYCPAKLTRNKIKWTKVLVLLSFISLFIFSFIHFNHSHGNRIDGASKRTMAYQTFLAEYMQIPIVTRIYTTACVITTIAVVSWISKIGSSFD